MTNARPNEVGTGVVLNMPGRLVQASASWAPRRLTMPERWARIRRSPFAAHLRAAYNSALTRAAAMVVASIVLAVLTRGQFLTWDGWQELPTTPGGAR